MSDQIKNIQGRAIPIVRDDVDTDQIMPARFLTAITFEGMEKTLFCDERERTPDHPIDNPDYRGARLLFAGKNFGSGSSREHAPQAIMRHGIEAIVGISFGEIFAGNCQAIGVPILTASPEDMLTLFAHTQKNPSEIALRTKLTSSIMPEGLLNKLSREEILDLIAYVHSAGDKEHKLFEAEHHH